MHFDPRCIFFFPKINIKMSKNKEKYMHVYLHVLSADKSFVKNQDFSWHVQKKIKIASQKDLF
jgi:hypothetical protein